MKAEELKLGNWVKFLTVDGGEVCVQVTQITDGIIYGRSEKGLHWAYIRHVEGIPLTKQILEKE